MAIIKLNNQSVSALTALPAGLGGKILQVVTVNHEPEATSSSTSYSDTGLTASITPSSSSNKILIIVNQNGLEKDNSDIKIQARLLRGSTNLTVFIGDETLNTST